MVTAYNIYTKVMQEHWNCCPSRAETKIWPDPNMAVQITDNGQISRASSQMKTLLPAWRPFWSPGTLSLNTTDMAFFSYPHHSLAVEMGACGNQGRDHPGSPIFHYVALSKKHILGVQIRPLRITLLKEMHKRTLLSRLSIWHVSCFSQICLTESLWLEDTFKIIRSNH